MPVHIGGLFSVRINGSPFWRFYFARRALGCLLIEGDAAQPRRRHALQRPAGSARFFPFVTVYNTLPLSARVLLPGFGPNEKHVHMDVAVEIGLGPPSTKGIG